MIDLSQLKKMTTFGRAVRRKNSAIQSEFLATHAVARWSAAAAPKDWACDWENSLGLEESQVAPIAADGEMGWNRQLLFQVNMPSLETIFPY